MKTILSLICLLTFVTLLNAQKAGTLDKSFGDTGVVTEQNYLGSCSSLLLQGDGKLVTTGGGGYDNTSGFSAYRLLPDGSPDLSFGDSGRAAYKVAKSSQGSYGSLQPNGKLVQAGTSLNNQARTVLRVIRYKTNGDLDSTFGTNGIVVTDFGSYAQLPAGVLIQSDSKILVAGITSDNTNNGPADTIFIVRYNTNGSVDESFGTNGVYRESPDDPFGIRGAALQSDGKILIGGSYEFTKSRAFFVKRYTTNGRPDSTFGVNGEADYGLTGLMSSGAWSILNLCLQPDGKILAAGWIASPFIPVATLVRFNNNGTVDSSFGTQGMVQTTVIANQLNEFNAVAVQSNNKIVAAGSVYNSIGDTSQYTVTRYLSNGKLDSAFGTNGTTITNVGQDAYASAIVVQANGNIVIAGNVYNPTPPFSSVVLVRYNSNGTIISEIKTLHTKP